MKIEEQVCSLIQAKRLKELGVTQEVIYCHIPVNNLQHDKFHVEDISYVFAEYGEEWMKYGFAAYTVAELGKMLPARFVTYKSGDDKYDLEKGLYSVTSIRISEIKRYYDQTEARARAGMLIMILEDKIITAAEINNSLIK